MRGPWSRKTPRRVSITPAEDKQQAPEVRKAKRVAIALASEQSKPRGS